MKQTKQKKDLPTVECTACRKPTVETTPVSFRRYHYRLKTYRTIKGIPCTNCGYIIQVREKEHAAA